MKIEVGKTYETTHPLKGLPKDYAVEVISEMDKNGWFSIKGLNSKDGIILHEHLFKKTFSPHAEETPSKPAHYDTAIDTIAFAKANFSREQVQGFMRINAIKYLQRVEKGEVLSDLLKARSYLDMLIEMEEEEQTP